MNEGFTHTTVLLQEAVAMLRPQNHATYVDLTLGAGGHTRALLAASGPLGKVIAFDQDEHAVLAAQSFQSEYKDRLTIVRANFRDVRAALDELSIDKVDGLLCDLGVSSPQLDEGERGFSYQHDAPLDMRMDQRQRMSAKDLVAKLDARELTEIFRFYGEEKWAARIASFIVKERIEHPIETTGHLVEVIKKAVPAAARRDGPHPAKRVFQALRIKVNDELGALEDVLAIAPDILRPEARIAMITFHSLEDRLVKQSFVKESRECICPPHTPICTCSHVARMKIITRKPILPSQDEIVDNPRARSAKLRVAERLDEDQKL